VAGGVLAYLFGSAAAAGTDSCLPDEILFPCTETGLIRWHGPRWPAIPAGVVVYAAGMAADWFVAVR
jgi:hypothetical protein